MEPIFDLDLALARKLRALKSPQEGADFLMRRAAEDLSERLATVERRLPRAAALFSLTPHAADAIAESGKSDHVLRIETDRQLLSGPYDGLVATAETIPLPPESLDLCVSLLTLHEANDLPGLLVQVRRALKPDGLFLAAFAGAGTLQELRESLLQAEAELTGGATPRVGPFADVRDAGALLQRAGFALPVADIETVTVRYGTMFDLMRDLRAMGVTNTLVERSRRPATRSLFFRAAEIYQERFADADGRIRATFNIVWLSGWTPHESQQKPLRPGSAKLSLKSVLSPEKKEE
ncbi:MULTISPECIES: methyltransferase domain-containing protein [Chelativorans]|jgi:SAM-dependent methyltransferase|uniref:Methyltransferase type 11 n=1 Tax=Chelativorans sp. (strain BNC1) TaxID=266779 RepID=Q11DZ6_CHESB|nr:MULTISPECIES: methyltransferase domain-containing protein [Chelativorans]